MTIMDLLGVTFRVVIRRRGMSPFASQLPYFGFFFYERKAGRFMYCGTVEFVCAPSAVRHIPVL